MPTQDDLLRAIEKEPALTYFGMGIYQERNKSKEEREQEFAEQREKLRQSLHMFQLCCEWLSLQKPIQTINPKVGSSYRLKHAVEAYYNNREYIANGVFIAALIHMGIPYKVRTDSPNVTVALSSKQLKETESVRHATATASA